MATGFNTHQGSHSHLKDAFNDDPVARQLHRDRITAWVTVAIVVAVLAAIIGLAVFSGTPGGAGVITPLPMP